MFKMVKWLLKVRRYRNEYHMHAIIICCLYTLTDFFSVVYKELRVVNITDNLFTKQGNVGLKSAVYNQ